MYESIRFYQQIQTPSFVATPTAVVFNAATLAWVAAVVANGGTVSVGRKTLVNSLIVGLIADGVWAKLDRLWLLAGENQPSALTDLVADSLATAVNTPTFTTDRGYTGDGATNYIDTLFNPQTNGVAFTVNSCHASLWDVTKRVGRDDGEMSMFDGVVGWDVDITVLSAGSGTIIRMMSADAQFPTLDLSASTELLTINRDSSSTNQVYQKGSAVATTNTTAKGAVGNFSIFLDARNFNGSTDSYALDQLAAATFGGSLSATDASNLYSRLRTYMTAVGVP